MITFEKLKIYEKYRGDSDHYVRVNSNKHGLIMENGDFATIDGLLQDIEITKKGLSSETYLKTVSGKLLEICDSAETIKELKRLADTAYL